MGKESEWIDIKKYVYIYKWSIGIWKTAHQKSSGKCKLKPQYHLIFVRMALSKRQVITTIDGK